MDLSSLRKNDIGDLDENTLGVSYDSKSDPSSLEIYKYITIYKLSPGVCKEILFYF